MSTGKEIMIRLATHEDAKILATLGANTFWDTYHTNSNVEQKFIKKYISKAFSVEKIKSELADKNTFFLIVENEGKQVGYSKLILGSSRPEVSSDKPLEISRIYLAKESWGKNLGLVLLDKCIDEAKINDCDVIWLSVWKHNSRAIKFYKKHDFKIVGTHIFDLASSLHTDYIMARNFT